MITCVSGHKGKPIYVGLLMTTSADDRIWLLS